MIKVVSPKIWSENEESSMKPISEVLQWRLSCKKWNIVVDELLYENFEFFESKQLNEAMQNKTTNKLYQGYIDLLRFSEHFQSTHPPYPECRRSPFVKNKLEISEKFKEPHQVAETVSGILQNYGVHVRDVEISDILYRPFFIEWLSKMPNLVRLRIDATTDYCKYTGAAKEKLQFPKFENLKEIFVHKLPFPDLKQLVEQNRQISSITLEGYESTVAEEIYKLNLPNLQIMIKDKVRPYSMPYYC